jgi:hypothetical protein
LNNPTETEGARYRKTNNKINEEMLAITLLGVTSD